MKHSMGWFAMKMSSPELLLCVWHKQPAPRHASWSRVWPLLPGWLCKGEDEAGGLPAGLCSPSLPTGPECSHTLRFGQGPVFLELSKHLYWEMFHLVSSWRGSRGVQSSIACLELLGSDLGCKNIPRFWGPVRQQVLLVHLAGPGRCGGYCFSLQLQCLGANFFFNVFF